MNFFKNVTHEECRVNKKERWWKKAQRSNNFYINVWWDFARALSPSLAHITDTFFVFNYFFKHNHLINKLKTTYLHGSLSLQASNEHLPGYKLIVVILFLSISIPRTFSQNVCIMVFLWIRPHIRSSWIYTWRRQNLRHMLLF